MSSSSAPPSTADSRPTHVRYGVLVALCMAASIAYLGRNCLGVAVAKGRILTDLGCTREQMGWVMGPGFFLAYALFQIPSGWLGHAWGSRRVLPVIAILWSISTGLMALVVGFGSIFVTYLGVGAAQAGIFPNSASTIKKWFPASRIAIVAGALGGFMSVGGALAQASSGTLLQWVSWRFVFLLFAVPGLIWAAWFYIWFRDRPDLHAAVNDDELSLIRGRQTGTTQSEAARLEHREPVPWAAIFTSYSMWLIAAQQFCRATGYIFYSTWFPTYLKETRHVSTLASGLWSSLPLLAVVVGAMLGGTLVDWILHMTGSRRLSRQLVAVLSMLACAGLICLAYFAREAQSAVLLISAGSFCAAMGGPCAYAVTIDMAGRHVPIVFSTMNMAGNIGAAICPLLVVWLAETTNRWDYVLFFFVGVYVAAGICWALLNPSGTIFNGGETVASSTNGDR